MSNKKKPRKAPSETAPVRSSAAEYLTFVAASGHSGVEALYADENVWLSQKMMGLRYDVETPTINYHLKKIFDDTELQEDSVIRNFRITAADGKTHDTQHYNLSPICTPLSAICYLLSAIVRRRAFPRRNASSASTQSPSPRCAPSSPIPASNG